MAPKINDIVEKTGVSVSTVSRILNGEKKYKYAATTVEKVKQAAAELGYRPNYFARSLKEGRTHAIGLLGNLSVANFRSPFMSGLTAGVERAMMNKDGKYSLLVFGGNSAEGSNRTVDMIRKGLVDGMIFMIASGYLADFEKELKPVLEETGVPYVVIHSLSCSFGFNNVGVNSEQAGYLAAGYLRDKGHTQIAYYNPEPGIPLYEEISRGVARACSDQVGMDIIGQISGENLYDRAYKTFMALEHFPEAVVLPNDQSCMACLQAAYARGLKPGTDVEIIRISDILHFRQMMPKVPYIQHPVDEKADAALQMLMDIMEGKRDKHTIQQEVLEPELIV